MTREFNYERDVIQLGERRIRQIRAIVKRGQKVRLRLRKEAIKRTGRIFKHGVTDATLVRLRGDFWLVVKPDGYKTVLTFHPSWFDVVRGDGSR